jgi:hypothetical protein
VRRLAGLLRWAADRLDPVDELDEEASVSWSGVLEAGSPPVRSVPVDFDGLWRAQTADFAGYVDDGEEWHGGVYL